MLTLSFFTEKKLKKGTNPKICTKSKKLVVRLFSERTTNLILSENQITVLLLNSILNQ